MDCRWPTLPELHAARLSRDEDRSLRLLHDLRADRTEREPRYEAPAAVSYDDQVRVRLASSLEDRLGRVTDGPNRYRIDSPFREELSPVRERLISLLCLARIDLPGPWFREEGLDGGDEDQGRAVACHVGNTLERLPGRLGVVITDDDLPGERTHASEVARSEPLRPWREDRISFPASCLLGGRLLVADRALGKQPSKGWVLA
jgi:hypothetical protein